MLLAHVQSDIINTRLFKVQNSLLLRNLRWIKDFQNQTFLFATCYLPVPTQTHTHVHTRTHTRTHTYANLILKNPHNCPAIFFSIWCDFDVCCLANWLIWLHQRDMWRRYVSNNRQFNPIIQVQVRWSHFPQHRKSLMVLCYNSNHPRSILGLRQLYKIVASRRISPLHCHKLVWCILQHWKKMAIFAKTLISFCTDINISIKMKYTRKWLHIIMDF